MNSEQELTTKHGMTPRKRIKTTALDVVESESPTNVKPNDPRSNHQRCVIQLLLHALSLTYLGFATKTFFNEFSDQKCVAKSCKINWCHGYGFTLIMYILVYTGICYYKVLKPLWVGFDGSQKIQISAKAVLFLKRAYIVALIGGLIFYVIIDTLNDVDRLRSLFGIFFLIAIAFAISTNHSKINYSTVVVGFGLYFLLGIVCMRWQGGIDICTCMGDKVAQLLEYSKQGSAFVFGNLSTKGIFAFAVITVVFFASTLVSVGYYYGVVQWVVEKLGWILQTLMGTTVIESVNVATNIFLGLSESPFVIQPFLTDLTDSEIHAVMASGFATVSGTVMAAYISYGAEPAHLITSSVMAAPATLAFAKLMYPETEESKTNSKNIQMTKASHATVLEAAVSGATSAIPVYLGIISNVIAFVSFVAFANAMFNYFGGLLGIENLTLIFLMGKFFTPLAWAMGVDWAECEYVGQLIGLKTIINEFVAFERLGTFKADKLLNRRNAAIATYAVCGFGNLGSLGIFISILSIMCPEKKKNVIRVAIRALICGNVVCFMTASISGLLLTEDIYNNFDGTISNSTLT